MAKNVKKNKEVVIDLSPMPQKISALVLNKDLIVEEPETEIETFAKSVLRELNDDDKTIHRLAFESNPLEHNVYAGVYKQRLRLLPPYVIKRIAIQDDLVASIVLVRQNQMSAFGIPRPDRFSNGFTIEPKLRVLEQIEKEEPEAKIQRKQELQRRIADATKVILNCGYTDGVPDSDRLSFTQYLSQSARNAVLMGMISTEVIYRDSPNGNRKFHAFRVIDAGTIYKAAPKNAGLENIRTTALAALARIQNERLRPEKFENDEYAWVQVIDGRPVQAFTDQECLVHMFYPVPDVEMDGYPITPLDTAISAVTTHINIVTHNKLYFQYGRASHGMLVLTSQDADEKVLRNIKQMFNASINSASNCVAGNSQILTEKGAFSIESFLNGEEVKQTRIWTGTSWQDAAVYRVSEKKQLCKLQAGSGLTIECSPNHRFRTIGVDGEPCWKELRDLQIGDFLTINKKNASNNDFIPTLNGKVLNEDMMEVLGWAIGDGTYDGRSLELFYHHDKDREIWQKHHEVLKSYGAPSVNEERTVSEDEKEYLRSKYGFKDIANSRLTNTVHCKEFVQQIVNLGFGTSCKEKGGKDIAPFVYVLPEPLKAAFVRGLYAADGCCASQLNAWLTSCNNKLRKQVRMLLISMGIRTSLKEGLTKRVPGKKTLDGKNLYIPGETYLKIKDRNTFFEKVGFIQDHKQPRKTKGTNKHWGTSNRIDHRTVLKYLRIIKDKTKLPRGGGAYHNPEGKVSPFTRAQQADISAVLRGDDSCTLSRLLNYMDIAKVEAPTWMTDYSYEMIIDIQKTDDLVQMFDTTIYDHNHSCIGHDCKSDTHSLMINGIFNHQSFRMPVFSIGQEDKLQWQAIDTQGKDAEFQYLTDMNARVIMTAFMMSPDELPGWSYLDKGTASQALSESNSEYKLEAARDTGIRPLMRHFEDFLNSKIFPLIDPVLAEMCEIKLMGLDADTSEKEAVKLQQDMQTFLTMDELLEKVDKKAVGRQWAGEFFFNPAYQGILDKYYTVGEVKEHFFGHVGAKEDPRYDYIPNAFFMQWKQAQQADRQMDSADKQMEAQQQAPAEGDASPGEAPADDAEANPAPQEESKPLLGDKIKEAESAISSKQ